MANYQTIHYVREAVQLEVPETQTDVPLILAIDDQDLPIYRDPSGFYVLVNTKYGTSRANEGQWAVLMEEKVPEVPSIEEVKSVGSYTISGVAAGDGKVGFIYNGVEYTVIPVAGQTAEATAQAIALLVNSTYGIIANVVGGVISLTSRLSGTNGNLSVVDISVDTVQTGTGLGLTGGVDYVPGTPEVPAVFEIYNEGDFQAIYEPEVI